MASNNTHNEPHTPRPTRMVTRAKNATVHPGALLRDAQRSRRTREEIAEEKELKNLQTEAKQRKKLADEARKARGRASIQQLEKIEAAATANAEHEFPRHRDKANVPSGKGRERTQSQKPIKARQTTHSQEIGKPIQDTDVEDHPPKRTKTEGLRYGNQPLRRTETTLESMLIDAEPKCMVNSSDSDFSMDNGVEREEDESTPQPRGLEKKASVLDLSSADEPYETPMTLRRKNRGVAIKRKREQVADTTDNGKKKRTVGDTFNNGQLIINDSNTAMPSRKPMAAKKIDLLSRFKQSKPSHSNGHIEQDSRRSKSGSLAHPDQKSNIPSRMTASNGIVGSKPSSKVRPAYEKSQTLQLVAPKQSHSMIESRALGGMSEEDDSLEKDLALSSPVKGSEYRAATKSMVKLKAEQSETKSRRPATVQDLPKGANEDAAWSRLVVPNFINLILAGNQPWIITDDLIIAELQCIWDHVYGRRVEFAIEKGTVPYKLITQKLCDYRNRLAYKAICVAVAYIRSHLDAADEDSFDDLGDELAEFADSLLNHEIPQAFIFKGMENIQKPKRTGTFRHTLVIKTLSAHFSNLTQGQSLKGLKIGKPQLGLALATAAVERALSLLANRMIEERVDTKGKNTKLAVRKSLNPGSGKSSKFLLEFSAAGWNQITLDYLDSIQNLGDARLTEIFDEAKAIALKAKPHSGIVIEGAPRSSRSTLQSDDESEGSPEV